MRMNEKIEELPFSTSGERVGERGDCGIRENCVSYDIAQKTSIHELFSIL
jgi:hypothetical protein